MDKCNFSSFEEFRNPIIFFYRRNKHNPFATIPSFFKLLHVPFLKSSQYLNLFNWVVLGMATKFIGLSGIQFVFQNKRRDWVIPNLKAFNLILLDKWCPRIWKMRGRSCGLNSRNKYGVANDCICVWGNKDKRCFWYCKWTLVVDFREV